ncbi:hypothetical protein GCG54_00003038 [Colletotrichum gloeosporioides]|uniref:Uncharacterized protein n=1 Tax=Colletotrichum gloeosporioides TaxID=474922 RepID=A0A8H4FQP7_COLGL|nr:uncharacterized protein GCG54_00003038 [Colletotrichum gloeosporioides]KAF3810861.1 hypothetical protein GCG54_00003038 [Colletotrichum gloeosporioides]
MPVIYSEPLRPLLSARDGDDDGDGGFHMPGTVMAIIIVCVLVFVGGLGLCCCCCRRRKRKGSSGSGKDDGSGSNNNGGFDPTKWIKKAVKKTTKKIKKMFMKKNKNKKEKDATANESVPYGQGTHPGFGDNERGYNRLDAHAEEETVGMTSPYGQRN